MTASCAAWSQLTLVVRLREGHSLASAARIIGLEGELADAHDVITGLRGRLGEGGR